MGNRNIMEIDSVLVVKHDRLYAHFIEQTILSSISEARCCVVHRIREADQLLAQQKFDLVVTGVDDTQGDVFEWIARLRAQRSLHCRILIITDKSSAHVAALARTLGVAGVFDSASDRPANLSEAMLQISMGRTYWSPSLRLSSTANYRDPHGLRLLTPTERLVLSILSDGSDDKTAGETLGLRTVSGQSVRKRIHGKLGIRQKGELVRIAAQHGFVRFTHAAVIRVGLGQLLAEYHVRSKRPVALPQSLAEQFPYAAEAAARRRRSGSPGAKDTDSPLN